MANLFLLADHIKLSLLERQRAVALNLEPTSQDGHISRSLDSLREGLENIVAERIRLQESGDLTAASALEETETSLQKQYADLAGQFHGVPTDTTSSTLSHPNDLALSDDFTRAADRRPTAARSSSFRKKAFREGTSAASPSLKSVRFSNAPAQGTLAGAGDGDEEEAARAALFPYRDDPTSGGAPDQSHLDNQQIHAYHSRVLAEQDEALDRLGESIGRQRELSIQIGDELEEHVQMLDDVDRRVDRHQGSLDKARRNLGSVARKAKDNMQLTVIVCLIVILVLLIIILK